MQYRLFLCYSFFCQKSAGYWDTLKIENNINGRSECGMAACNRKLYLIDGPPSYRFLFFNPPDMPGKSPNDSNHSPPPVGGETEGHQGFYPIEVFSMEKYMNRLQPGVIGNTL